MKNAGLLALLLFVLFFAVAPYLTLAFTENEGIYGAVAQEMRHGALLYKDVWDHKPPLIYLEYQVIQRLFGSGEAALHLCVLLCHWVCAGLLFLLGKRLGFASPKAWAAAFTYGIFIAPPWFQNWTGQADLAMQPWLLGSFLLLMAKKRWSNFLAGMAWSLAFFTKQTAMVYLPIYLIFSEQGGLETIVEFILGADVVGAAVVSPFYFSDRMGELGDAVWGFNAIYVTKSWVAFAKMPNYYGSVLMWALKPLLAYGLAWIALVRGARLSVVELRTRVATRPWTFILIWFVLAFVGCSLSGRFTSYYFVALLAPMALATGVYISDAKASRKALLVAAAIGAGAMLLGYFGSWTRSHSFYQDAWYPKERLEAAKVMGEQIRSLSMPGDQLLAWTTEPEIYVYSGLPMALVPTPLVNHLSEMPPLIEGARLRSASGSPRFVVLSDFDQVIEAPAWLKTVLETRYLVAGKAYPYTLYKKIE